MKHNTSMDLQLNSDLSPNDPFSPSTPTKDQTNPSPFYLPPISQHMMLIETPIKHKTIFIDPFLEQEQHHHFLMPEDITKLHQELPQNIFDHHQSQDLQNKQPNIQPQNQHKITNKKIQTIMEEETFSNQATFKTPGRSNRSNALSTTNKKKPCTCKKSGCLKKYCECFKSGEVCNENCDCIGCKNNDLAHLKTMTQSSTKQIQIMCNCRKSNCLKGYCDCHTAGKRCSELCNCIDCKNIITIPSQFALPQASSSKRVKKVRWSQDYEDLQSEFN